MIQATAKDGIQAYINTEANRIERAVSVDNIRHLCKYTNDLSGDVFYAYNRLFGASNVNQRYTSISNSYSASPAVLSGTINISEAGYYTYEIYEVAWKGMVVVSAGYAPVTELDVLSPVTTSKGIVQGLVAMGKMYVDEQSGKEEVQYIQNAKSVQTLTISYGGAGYTTAPTITITGDNITQATATCTVSGGAVDTVTITNAGSGYTTNPTVTVSGGGGTFQATITADINEENYIYYGQ